MLKIDKAYKMTWHFTCCELRFNTQKLARDL